MAQLREIKNRIKAVGNIQRITKTMQMIATAKFQASVRRTQATQPYTKKIGEIAGELSQAGGDIEHALLSSPQPAKKRELILVLSSNRGLCGAYNANVLRTSSKTLKAKGDDDINVDLEVVGKKGVAFFRFQEIAIEQSHTQFTDKPAYEEVEKLGDRYIEAFTKGEYDAVRVVYMKFISNARQEPTVQTLLPLEPPAAEEGETTESTGPSAVYEFSPSPEELLDTLLPMTVKAQLFQCFNDAVVSEQISRMVAMKSATDNAGKMGRNLKRTFNRARQAQITTELTEIIGGAAALE